MVDSMFELFEGIMSDEKEEFLNIVEAPRKKRVLRERPIHLEM